jgi:glycosyltransferase involved in cell wall biosynthesis
MYAGAFDEVRGVFKFLSLAERLFIERDDIVCWISGYGSDEMHEHVRHEVERFDGGDVEFFGTLPWDDYRTRLASADLLVSPQDPAATISQYTFPSKLLDFMATGNYVVSTDIEGIDDHFQNKVVLGGKTSDSLKRTVLDVLNHPEQFADRTDLAVEWIDRECTYDRISAKVNQVVTNAAKTET